MCIMCFFFFSSRRRHTRCGRDWSSDVCSSDLDPALLILDEATSSIDTETEQLIQQAIERVMRDRTSIVVAHRLSTIQNASRIIVLHHGEIREQGTHQELLAERGLYWKLYKLQYADSASRYPGEKEADSGPTMPTRLQFSEN